MKKLALSLVLFCSLVVVPTSALDIVVGPRVGAGYAFLYGSDYTDYLNQDEREREFQLGYLVGAFAEIGIIPFLAVQPEILFTGGGGTASDISGDSTLRTKHIEIPVLIKGTLGIGGLGVSAFAGPNLMIPVGQWTSDSPSTGKIDLPMENARDVIFGGVFGAGVTVPAGPGRLMIDLRTHLAFTPSDDLPDGSNQKTGAVLATVGYGFGL